MADAASATLRDPSKPLDHLFGDHEFVFVVDDDHVTQLQLAPSPSFQFAVHRDISFLNGDLRLTTSPHKTCDLQELIECNRRWLRSSHEFDFQERQFLRNDDLSTSNDRLRIHVRKAKHGQSSITHGRRLTVNENDHALPRLRPSVVCRVHACGHPQKIRSRTPGRRRSAERQRVAGDHVNETVLRATGRSAKYR